MSVTPAARLARAEQSGPRVLGPRIVAWLAAHPGSHTPTQVARGLGDASALSVRQVAAALAAEGRVRIAYTGHCRWLLEAASLGDALWARLNRDGWWVERAALVRWARDEHDATAGETAAALRDLLLAGRAEARAVGADCPRDVAYRAVRR